MEGSDSQDQRPRHDHEGIRKVQELIYDVEMIKQAHQEQKRSLSRKSRRQKLSMDAQVLALIRKKQEQEFLKQQKVLGGIGAGHGTAPIFSARRKPKSHRGHSAGQNSNAWNSNIQQQFAKPNLDKRQLVGGGGDAQAVKGTSTR